MKKNKLRIITIACLIATMFGTTLSVSASQANTKSVVVQEAHSISTEQDDNELLLHASEKVPSVQYRTHVQTYGWQNYVKDGAMSGTQGQSKRLEGINIRLENLPVSGGIEYRTHVQRIGWQDYVKNGAMSGTSGKSLRLEAIQIRLTGEIAKQYDIYYQTHIQHFGWSGWAKTMKNADLQASHIDLKEYA